MTDLVERLRLMGLANPPLREAADEIERLLARVAELEKAIQAALTHCYEHGAQGVDSFVRGNVESILRGALDAAMREGKK